MTGVIMVLISALAVAVIVQYVKLWDETSRLRDRIRSLDDAIARLSNEKFAFYDALRTLGLRWVGKRDGYWERDPK